jgi:hypothetical protein
MSICIFMAVVCGGRLAPRERKPVAVQRCEGRGEVVGGGQKIAGELFGEEAVVGFVCVEGGDDVVAVAPGVLAGEVVVDAVSMSA